VGKSFKFKDIVAEKHKYCFGGNIYGGIINRGEFSNIVKRFDKSVGRARKGLGTLRETKDFLLESLELLKIIEQGVREDPSLAEDFQSISAEKGSISSWEETRLLVSELHAFIENSVMDVDNSSAFIETFRNNRTYTFPNTSSSVSFLGNLAEVFSINKFELKPQFIGTMDLEAVASDLKLKKGKSSICVNPAELERVVSYLSKNRLSSNLLFESKKLRVFWHNSRVLRVAAKHPVLKRLDLLCRSLNGKCVEKPGYQATL